MKKPRWLSTNQIVAAAALLGGGVLIAPEVFRAANTAAIGASLTTRHDIRTRCHINPDAETGWFDLFPARDCLVETDDLHMPQGEFATADTVFKVSGYSTALFGSAVNVYSQSGRQLTRVHEEIHRQQGDVAAQGTVNRVVFRSFREADAWMGEIVHAYRVYLQTGETELWDEANRSSPDMVRVFDTLLREDEQSREAMADGGLPSVMIMRRTAMSYFFTARARNYLNNHYRGDYRNFDERMRQGNLTLTAEDLARALPREGTVYLFDIGLDNARSPLNRWMLYETLGVGLGNTTQQTVEDEQPVERSNITNAAAAAAADETPAENMDQHTPEALAYRTVALQRFHGRLTNIGLAVPLAGIELPATRGTLVSMPTRQAPPRPCPRNMRTLTGTC